MKSIPGPLQTLYLDLLQQVSADAPATVYTANIKGKQYLKADERHGATRISRHLGPADDPDVGIMANRLRAGAQAAKNTRKLVTTLRNAGIAGPPQNMGRVLEVLANAGLFEIGGVVLVGTAAYICYSGALGYYLSSNLMTTQDVDLSVVTFAIKQMPPVDLLEILKRADPSFAAEFNRNHDKAPPTKFQNSAGLQVETLTTSKRNGNPVPVPELKSGAVALPYQDYLVEDPERFVALYGSGVPVLAPRPSRFGVHKLIVSNLRPEGSAKRAKDLMQAKVIRDVLLVSDPNAWNDSVDDARDRGKSWAKLVDAGLKAIG